MREDQRRALAQLLCDISQQHAEHSCDEYDITVSPEFAKELAAADVGWRVPGERGKVSTSIGSMCDYFYGVLESKS